MKADKNSENILTKEIESWKGFEYALRNPNASLFSKMLKECLENEEYAEASKTRGSLNSAESSFMALIFQQQKMISGLIERLNSNKKKIKGNLVHRISCMYILTIERMCGYYFMSFVIPMRS